MQTRLLLLASLATWTGAVAAAPPTVLRAARLYDGKSASTSSPGVVVVRAGRIEAVGAQAAVPADAVVIDLGDATLLPGFMDAHTHLSGEMSDDFKSDQLDGLQQPVAQQAIESVERARRTLFAGFTTVRDVGASDLIDVGLRNAIDRGKVLGPRMLVATHAIGATGGHCDDTGWRPGVPYGRETGIEEGVANGPDQIRAAVRYNVKYGANVIKVCATGGVLSLADDVDTPQLTQAELDALVDEAHALRRKTAAHAHGATGAKRAIQAGIDSIEHGTFLDDEALAMMKKRGTFLVPTVMALVGLQERLARNVALPPQVAAKAKAAIARHADMLRRAVSLGVRIALGTDAGVYPHGRNGEEFAHLVRAGMKPLEALRAGTSAAAELLGIADRTGTLEAGKIADVVAVPGDPSRDIHATEHVVFVMKEGSVVRNDRAHPAAAGVGQH